MTKARHAKKIDIKKIKIFALCCLFVLSFGLVVYKLLCIQVLKRDFYVGKLDRQYEMSYARSSNMRGEIYDRNGIELAVSVLSYSLYADKTKITDIKLFSEELGRLLRMPAENIRKSIEQSESKGIYLARKLEDQGMKTALRNLKKDGKKGISEAFEILEESKRFYPYKQLASHVIGFANEDNVGLEGIEYFFDRKIAGSMEKASYTRDVSQGVFRRGKGIKKGNGLELTIDKDIQAFAEEELKKQMIALSAKSGFVIVMDPESGEILALTSYPTYDPNRYADFSQSERKNRAVLDVVEPGSVLKVFLAAAALQDHVVSPSTTVNCENGFYHVNDRVFKEAHHGRYGALSVAQVIQHSSNIGSIKIAEKLGKKKLHQFYTDFGFGKKTELGFQGESKGIMPTLKELTPVRLSTVAFGQGISLNPVQIATAFCAVVNGGYLLKPIVVRRVLDEDNNVLWENQKEIVRKVIDSSTSVIMRDILRSVITEGTGKGAAIPETTVIGKTGTAQKAGKRGYTSEYLASFIGAFPADKPKYVMYIGVDSPQKIFYGGAVAAPIFREIGKKIMDSRGEERKIKVLKGETITAAVENRDHAAFRISTSVTGGGPVPNLKGLSLREVIKVVNTKKLHVSIEGSGTVARQEPEPGGQLGGDRKIRVVLR